MLNTDDQYNLAVLFFCYRGEGELLRRSTRQVIEVAKNSGRNVAVQVSILYDAEHPLTHAELKALKDELPEDTRFEPTYYFRNGNQHGHDCILGMLKEMDKASVLYPYGECHAIVKVDPDTMIRSLDYVFDLVDDKDAVFTASYKREPMYAMGLTYALEPYILSDLIADEEKYPSHHDALENYEISRRIIQQHGEDGVIRLEHGVGVGDMCISEPHEVDKINDQMRAEIKGITAYSCGFSYNATPPDKKPEYRQRQYAFMDYLATAWNATDTNVGDK